MHRIGRTGRAGREGRALLLVTPRERRMLQVIERVTGQKVAEARLPNAQAVLDARIKKLTSSLAPLVAEAEATHGELFDRLTTDLGCSARALQPRSVVRRSNSSPWVASASATSGARLEVSFLMRASSTAWAFGRRASATFCPVTRSITCSMRRSRGVTSSSARPSRPARPVRPIRCT